MTDNQIDKLKEIESIAQLMQIANIDEQINGDIIQSLGNQILSKCFSILSVEL